MTWTIEETPGRSIRVLVGDSVYEDAVATVYDGRLRIDFEADDLDTITIDLAALSRTTEGTE